jgi:hypothetical protein
VLLAWKDRIVSRLATRTVRFRPLFASEADSTTSTFQPRSGGPGQPRCRIGDEEKLELGDWPAPGSGEEREDDTAAPRDANRLASLGHHAVWHGAQVAGNLRHTLGSLIEFSAKWGRASDESQPRYDHSRPGDRSRIGSDMPLVRCVTWPFKTERFASLAEREAVVPHSRSRRAEWCVGGRAATAIQ